MAKRVSVIDIGSNSVRMIIYEKTSRFAFHILHEVKAKVRISEDAYKNGGYLQDIPMQRTFNALKDFISISKSFKSRKTLCVATSALRDAPNRYDFLRLVKNRLDLKIKVIDGQKEAYFGAVAVNNLLPKFNANSVTIDIGGGSTELALINNHNITKTISLNLGTVRLKELFFDLNNIDEAIKYIDNELSVLDDFQADRLIGIGGTFRSLALAILKSSNYPLQKLHAFEIKQDVLNSLIENILNATSKDELKKLKIDSNRFDIIKPGALIVQRVLKRLNTKNIITSGVGVREGVYLSDLLRTSKHRFPANFNPSVKYLIDRYIDDTNYSNNLNKLAKQIFDLTHKEFNIDKKYRYELALSAKLYPIGSSIHYYSQNKHSYFLIQTALEYGFSHKQIALISTLVKFAKNKMPSDEHIDNCNILLPKDNVVKYLNYILSISIALLSHRPRDINFNLSFSNNTLNIESKNELFLAKDSILKIDKIDNFNIKFIDLY